MASELDAALRALVEKQRAENAKVFTPVREQALPNLDPQIFLSPVAKSEMEAAIGWAEPTAFPSPQASEEELTSLWTEHLQDEIPTNGFEVEFDLLDGVEPTAPNERVRFQVGRDTPRYDSFEGGLRSGMSEGNVVSRRGADGRFHNTEPVRPTPRTVREIPLPTREAPARAPTSSMSKYDWLLRDDD